MKIFICRCLTGSGASLEGIMTDLMRGQFLEVRDSLRAIGFSERVSQSEKVRLVV